MRTGYVLFSAIHFLFLAMFVCIGLFFLSLPTLPHLKVLALKFFSLPDATFYLAGGVILSVALSLFGGFWVMNKTRYFQLEMQLPSGVIEIPVVRSLVQRYWEEKFPKSKGNVDVVLHKRQKIEIFLPLPNVSDLEMFLTELEKELGVLLKQNLGYDQPFRLTFLCS